MKAVFADSDRQRGMARAYIMEQEAAWRASVGPAAEQPELNAGRRDWAPGLSASKIGKAG